MSEQLIRALVWSSIAQSIVLVVVLILAALAWRYAFTTIAEARETTAHCRSTIAALDSSVHSLDVTKLFTHEQPSTGRHSIEHPTGDHVVVVWPPDDVERTVELDLLEESLDDWRAEIDSEPFPASALDALIARDLNERYGALGGDR